MPGEQTLPHFKNSRAAVEHFEPLFLNQFEVLFTPPAAIGGGAILMEHVKKISGLPEITPVGFVEQWYKWAKRTSPKSKPEDTTAELEIDFEVNLDNENNSMYVYNTLRAWSDLIFDPMTGSQSMKRDVVGSMSVHIYNKAQKIYREFVFSPVYLIDPLKSMDLEYLSEDIYVLTAKFKADAWTEKRNLGEVASLRT